MDGRWRLGGEKRKMLDEPLDSRFKFPREHRVAQHDHYVMTVKCHVRWEPGNCSWMRSRTAEKGGAFDI